MVSTWYRDNHRAVCAQLTHEEHAKFAERARRQGQKISQRASALIRADLQCEEAPSTVPETESETV